MYGYREGPVISFTDWYPTIAERDQQRRTFKPLCITTDSPTKVDGDLSVSLVNTFKHPVTATVDWSSINEEDAKKTDDLARPAERVPRPG